MARLVRIACVAARSPKRKLQRDPFLDRWEISPLCHVQCLARQRAVRACFVSPVHDSGLYLHRLVVISMDSCSVGCRSIAVELAVHRKVVPSSRKMLHVVA